MTCFFHKFVDSFKFPVLRVDNRSLFNRLVCTRGRYLIGNFPVKPAYRTTESGMFRSYYADMVRGKGLAERAGIIGIDIGCRAFL